MEIKIEGDASIGRQTRVYAEYRLFAALAPLMDATRVRSASLVLRRAGARAGGGRVACTVSVERDDGDVARFHADGGHPYAAIDRAVARMRLTSPPARRRRAGRWD